MQRALVTASAGVINSRLQCLAGKVRMHDCNLTGLSSLIRVVGEVRPVEVFNLAEQPLVKSSVQQFDPARMRPGDIPRHVGDTSLAAQLLGWPLCWQING
jgi:GDP-D-mannose dehydratase